MTQATVKAPRRFRPGSVVVHPVHGFCRITSIEHQGIDEYYVFRVGPAQNPVKILVPVDRARGTGVREPISRREAEEVLQVFRGAATPYDPRTKEQLDEVSKRLNSPDVLCVAATIRDLMAAGVKGRQGTADGTFVSHRRSEQAILMQALRRLVEEMAAVLDVPSERVEGQIRKSLQRGIRRSGAVDPDPA